MKRKIASPEVKEEKIFFRLEQDEDGYPPNEWESLWATALENGHYTIDNIPFFVRDISCGDIISARKEDDRLYFDEVVEESRNSVIRVIVYDESGVPELRRNIEQLNCESEQSHIANLIAVEIPENVDLEKIVRFLDKGEKEELWEYETASIRH